VLSEKRVNLDVLERVEDGIVLEAHVGKPGYKVRVVAPEASRRW
jgi:hypothetical protein